MDHFNYFKSILTPEMPRHIAKWGSGSTLADWNKNMDTLQSKIQQRCTYIESKIKNCYSVTGPYPIAVDVSPAGAGEVKLNTIWLPNYMWHGNYFGGVSMSFEQRLLNPAYEFDRWEFKHHVPSPSATQDTVTINYTTSDTVVAYYKLIDKSEIKGNEGDIIFPTAFTPNGDGHNDVLFPLGANLNAEVSIEIWNRWGQLVYSSNDPSKGWDGNFKGTAAQPGVYAYLIKYSDYEGGKKTSKGNITLIR